jgi:hypothetical protein
MSSIAMTDPERIAALENLGYTSREAVFLCLAALHGGYFLRRQYCGFIGKETGGNVAALVEKLLTQKHAVAISALHNTKIYHLGSRPFYTLLGETDNRNRREHSAPAMKKRLMSLDFVLAHPNYSYLATEREKLDYFSGTLGVSLGTFPYKRYISHKTPSSTTRYFVDKYPIFLSESNPNGLPLRSSFCFVDEGLTTLSSFETYLQQYSGSWRVLNEFQVIYAADSKRLFQAAERRFAAFCGQLKSSEFDPNARQGTRMLQHFDARFLYENGDFASFSREKLVRLRNETVEFSGPEHQDLYERWKAVGAKAVVDAIAPKVRMPVALNASFSTYFVDRPYNFFGTTERAEFSVR